jgi:hypothetical protein
MAHALKEVARVDPRWFRAHPERRHRCRWPDTIELDVFIAPMDALGLRSGLRQQVLEPRGEVS